jgi:hypothetical protein
MLHKNYILTVPGGRMGNANQLKAAELLLKIGSALEEIRDEVPVSCPECKHVFTV